MSPIQFLWVGTVLLFIGFKMADVIAWSWWLVLLPLYAPFVLSLLCYALSRVVYWSMSPEERARHDAAERLKDLADYLGKR
jgi:membrane protein implicated in regulation of membrane protease activity